MGTYDHLLKRQHDFYETDSTKNIEFRIQALKNLEYLLKANEQKLMKAMKIDLNKSAFESYSSEIGIVLHEISFVIKHLKKWSRPKRVKTSLTHLGSKGYVHYDPYGTTLLIGPWNYPVQLTLSPLIGAIAAGNCAVVKPSELTPNTADVLSQLIRSAFPEEYITVIQGDAEVTQELLELDFDYIFFTGSVPVGKIVMEAAAKTLTPVTLELGGKSPGIVHKDADIKLAAKRLAWGKFMNAGQTCVAPDYLYVHREVKEKFKEALIDAVKSLYGEYPLKNQAYTHIVNQNHFHRIEQYLTEGTIVYGGDKDLNQLVIEPTILEEVAWEDSVMQQEIFGPVLPILEYDDLSEVMEGIARNPNPLALYLFTQDQQVENRIVGSISFGGGCINDTVFHIVTPYLPFGGVGTSGMGSYHGKSSFETFSHQKSILKQTTLFDNPFRYPNAKNGLKILKYIMR